MTQFVLNIGLRDEVRSAEETTTVGTLPSHRWMMGPSLWARWANERWGMSVKRWRWPMIGRPAGDGVLSDFGLLCHLCR
jgi:hypothetical protein